MTGTLQITAGGQIFALDIDDTNSTLAGIAAAINSSAAGSKVMATVTKAYDPDNLTLVQALEIIAGKIAKGPTGKGKKPAKEKGPEKTKPEKVKPGKRKARKNDGDSP